MADDFTFGIEEEYFLVDAETKLVARGMPEAFFEAAEARPTAACAANSCSRRSRSSRRRMPTWPMRAHELRDLRQTVAAVAAEHGLAILAAGTHPTAVWSAAVQTQKERYDAVMDDLQMIGQRNMLCGCTCMSNCPTPTSAST